MINKICIITINWNGLADTIRCIKSVLNSNYKNYEVIVVDNNSKNNEARALINKFGKKIKLVASDKNLGFAGGNNLGANKANGDVLFFLNNDAVINPDTLEILQKNLLDESIGIIMPKILFYNSDKIQTAGNYTNIFSKTKLYMCGKNSVKFQTKKECEFASGAALMICKDLYDNIGGFHDFLFIYGDDNSLSYRSWIFGKKVICDGSAVVYHDESSSVRKKSRPWFSYHQVRALIATQIINFKISTLIKMQIFYSFYQFISFIKRIFLFEFKFALSIPKAYFWVILHLPVIIKHRSSVQKIRHIQDDSYLGK